MQFLPNRLRGANSHCSDTDFSDNIGNLHLERYLAYGPIDAVYSWVNGSDPVWQAKKAHWTDKLLKTANKSVPVHANISDGDDTNSLNRFRDSEELRYSLRSLEKYAPWLRNIYIVTDNQMPYWLNMENSRLHVIPHSIIFPNKSDLPVFSSPAIESHLHRIPGLSKKFIYFNDDVFLGSPTLPEDFYTLSGAQRLYMAWDVPKCAPGCSDTWIGDGYCDKACNVSACNFDYPDCVNGTSGKRGGARGASAIHSAKEAYFCASGCPDSWLGDKVCDAKCKSVNCGWDGGDCGVELVVEDFKGVSFLSSASGSTDGHVPDDVSVLKARGGHALDGGHGSPSSREWLLLGPPPPPPDHQEQTVPPSPESLLPSGSHRSFRHKGSLFQYVVSPLHGPHCRPTHCSRRCRAVRAVGGLLSHLLKGQYCVSLWTLSWERIAHFEDDSRRCPPLVQFLVCIRALLDHGRDNCFIRLLLCGVQGDQCH